MRTEEILQYWFRELDQDGCASEETAKRWFRGGEEVDKEITGLFSDDYQAIVDGQREDWLKTPRGRLAYIIVLDQFARNMFRGTPGMYAADPIAVRVCKEGIEAGADKLLRTDERAFFYMPLMHWEEMHEQDMCVKMFEGLLEDAPTAAKEAIARNLEYAHKHRVIVERFGRYPHRNDILGRECSHEEQEFLKEPGSSF